MIPKSVVLKIEEGEDLNEAATDDSPTLGLSGVAESSPDSYKLCTVRHNHNADIHFN
jgi:hypothetical protein